MIERVRELEEKVKVLTVILICTVIVFIMNMFIMNDNKNAIIRCVADNNTVEYCTNLIEGE